MPSAKYSVGTQSAGLFAFIIFCFCCNVLADNSLASALTGRNFTNFVQNFTK